uniref:HlyD family secretion protein n=1 Tax=Candidatus Kentrum sp. UNK TaxID=2126344 RepID=A0A451AYI8_9GAMM|nr:MAG: HlyD family secretion protein [Candidatus Kentron sp. UNK]VFK71094.1 MAG: HlyD family secretion protein [Candidatus Kentron sp. UNK]
MKKHPYELLALAALLIALILVFVFLMGREPQRAQELYVTAERRNLTIRVETIGALEAENAHVISSSIPGDKVKITKLVDDGKYVKAGDHLVSFDVTVFEEEIAGILGEIKVKEAALETARQSVQWEKAKLERELKVAEYDIKAARADYRKLENGDGPIKLAELDLEMQEKRKAYRQSQAYLRELRTLVESGVSSEGELKNARDEQKNARHLYETARRKLDAYRDYVFPSELDAATALLQQAETELDQLQCSGAHAVAQAESAYNEIGQALDALKDKSEQVRAKLERSAIVAPVGGFAIHAEIYAGGGKRRKPRIGDEVRRGQPLLHLPDTSAYLVKTQIPETDLHRIQPGLTADISVDAYPGLRFGGKVQHLGVLAKGDEANTGRKYFHITLKLDGADRRLRPGMTARVSILIEHLEDVVVAPLHAVFHEGDSATVYRMNGKETEKTPVETGARDAFFMEIRAGVEAGDRLALGAD